MNILGLNKTTLLDFPGHVAATVFVGGCNMRCPFCHNKDLVFGNAPHIETAEILAFLTKRKNILSGVCITGGEPTLQPDLSDFIRDIKSIGYKIKLDTNGLRPDVLTSLIEDGLLDYVAMDLKNTLLKYPETVGVPGLDTTPIRDSISILLSHKDTMDFEFRTTLVEELHTKEDMACMCELIKGAPHYFLQSYTDSENVITPGFHAHENSTLHEFEAICREIIPTTVLRGVD